MRPYGRPITRRGEEYHVELGIKADRASSGREVTTMQLNAQPNNDLVMSSPPRLADSRARGKAGGPRRGKR